MASPLIGAYLDFVSGTGLAEYQDGKNFVNDATKASPTLPYFQAAGSFSLQGGQYIQSHLLPVTGAHVANYEPNPVITPPNPQVLKAPIAYWRFTEADTSITENEVVLQMGQMSKKAMFQKFVDLKTKMKADLFTAIVEQIDDAFWAAPSNADMELAAGTDPFSILATVNEYTQGHYPGFTTVQGLDPALIPVWDNYRAEYDPTEIAETTSTNLLGQLTLAHLNTNFKAMPVRAELGEPTTATAAIFCSFAGYRLVEQIHRTNQDRFVKMQDGAYETLSNWGAPFRAVSQIGTVAAFPTGSVAAQASATLSTEADATNTTEDNNGPRFFGINFKYLEKVWHETKYFDEITPYHPANQPLTWAFVVDCYHQLINRSRRHHFCLYPDTTV